MFVTPNWIVEALNVLKYFRLGLLPCFVNPLFDFLLFKLLKNDSATALCQQLPLWLLLAFKQFPLRQRLNLSLPNCEHCPSLCMQTPRASKAKPPSSIRPAQAWFTCYLECYSPLLPLCICLTPSPISAKLHKCGSTLSETQT
jgi:hypothetical protein